MPLLLVNGIDVYEDQRIRTVLELAGFTVVAIFASTSACSAASIPVAFLPTVVERQHVDVLVVANSTSVFWKRWVFDVIEALISCSKPHVLPPARADISHGETG